VMRVERVDWSGPRGVGALKRERFVFDLPPLPSFHLFFLFLALSPLWSYG
jgi:hypothetical protein